MVQMESSKLSCEECGKVMVIPRKRGQLREKGHIKHMYCYNCQEITAFVEGVVKDKKVQFWEEYHGMAQDD